jgi:hypothetical protein
MEPTMQTGDLAIVYRSAQYEVGDIVAFEIPEGGTVIHRVVERSPDGYRFQGDHRDFPDPWLLDDEAITGREVVTIPHAADVAAFLGRPTVMAALAMALTVLWWFGRSQPLPGCDERPTDVAPASHAALRTSHVWSPPHPDRLVAKGPVPRTLDAWRDPSGIAGGTVAVQLGLALLARADLLTSGRGRPGEDDGAQRRRTSGSRPVLP